MAEYTTEALVKWLRGQDPELGYIWSDPVFCLMGHYLADNGACWGERAYSDVPYYYEIAHQKPWTFGAALERAEAALKELAPPPLQLSAPKRELVTVDAE